MSLHTHLLTSRWLADGTPAVVVSVSEARGSAPRDAGTRMAVSATHTVGTIGGGHLELKAIEHARAMLSSPDGDWASSVHYPLGAALGQCCGGAVTLSFARLNDAVMRAWAAPLPLFHLQLYGAGHVGRAIARILSTLDARVDWIDEREEEFPPTLFDAGGVWPEHVRRVCVDAVEGEVPSAPPGGYYLVLTHNHDLDMRITEAILARGDFAYLGLIGSQTKRRRFMHRFKQRGVAADLLDRLTCPIGIEGITGKQPELIAVAVVAQLLQRQAALASERPSARSRGLDATPLLDDAAATPDASASTAMAMEDGAGTAR